MMKYKILQIPRENKEAWRKYGFVGLKYIDEVKASNYKEVWSGDIETRTDQEALGKLFWMFNTNHPEGYTSRSMSVSDVVELDGKYYYCDEFSWERVEMK